MAARPAPHGGYVFSAVPDGCEPLRPDTVTQRYKRMTERLGIDTTLKSLRHYSATELMMAGVDIRTIAGRLGHGSGGATNAAGLCRMDGRGHPRMASLLLSRSPSRSRSHGQTAATVRTWCLMGCPTSRAQVPRSRSCQSSTARGIAPMPVRRATLLG
jgi:hypothetical protein